MMNTEATPRWANFNSWEHAIRIANRIALFNTTVGRVQVFRHDGWWRVVWLSTARGRTQ